MHHTQPSEITALTCTPQTGFIAKLPVGPHITLAFLELRRWFLWTTTWCWGWFAHKCMVSWREVWLAWGVFSMCKIWPFPFVGLDRAQGNVLSCERGCSYRFICLWYKWTSSILTWLWKARLGCAILWGSCLPSPSHGELHPLFGLCAGGWGRELCQVLFLGQRFTSVPGLRAWSM